ncbi:hypothetical protein BH11MYX2_BH11MYX2_29550 [soil metagenome]
MSTGAVSRGGRGNGFEKVSRQGGNGFEKTGFSRSGSAENQHPGRISSPRRLRGCDGANTLARARAWRRDRRRRVSGGSRWIERVVVELLRQRVDLLSADVTPVQGLQFLMGKRERPRGRRVFCSGRGGKNGCRVTLLAGTRERNFIKPLDGFAARCRRLCARSRRRIVVFLSASRERSHVRCRRVSRCVSAWCATAVLRGSLNTGCRTGHQHRSPCDGVQRCV